MIKTLLTDLQQSKVIKNRCYISIKIWYELRIYSAGSSCQIQKKFISFRFKTEVMTLFNLWYIESHGQKNTSWLLTLRGKPWTKGTRNFCIKIDANRNYVSKIHNPCTYHVWQSIAKAVERLCKYVHAVIKIFQSSLIWHDKALIFYSINRSCFVFVSAGFNVIYMQDVL